jgi:hypothetical protein
MEIQGTLWRARAKVLFPNSAPDMLVLPRLNINRCCGTQCWLHLPSDSPLALSMLMLSIIWEARTGLSSHQITRQRLNVLDKICEIKRKRASIALPEAMKATGSLYDHTTHDTI